MGQKINPIGLRVGVIRPWNTRWFANKKDYAKNLHEDIKIKKLLKKKLYHAGISKIEIARAASKCTVDIFSARPGIIIGKRGAGIDALRAYVQRVTNREVALNIKEVRKAELDAQLVAENIAQQLERRMAFRRVMKRGVQSSMKLGAKGVKIRISGRLAGADIARAEWHMEGSVPLHTLKANIDYGTTEAKTTYGIIGVKVWINRGLFESSKERRKALSSTQVGMG
ncbi:MAG: 30S ribosomal protein S3 [Deltaproteobacteria bacterium]|nr:30S ribosomal protein S3 [Deltaproteobacteria bacterium]